MSNLIFKTNLIPDNINSQKELGSPSSKWKIYGEASTESSDTNDTTIATTAFVHNLIEIPITFSITLLASDWENTTQTIINSNFIVDGYTYIVSSSSSNINEYCLSSIYAGDVVTENEMTFYCQTIPSVDLAVNIIRLRTV